VFLALTGRTLREAGEGEPAEETETSDQTEDAASVTTGAER
jgi:ABC-2 type transport system ATP-binding protein